MLTPKEFIEKVQAMDDKEFVATFNRLLSRTPKWMQNAEKPHKLIAHLMRECIRSEPPKFVTDLDAIIQKEFFGIECKRTSDERYAELYEVYIRGLFA